MFHFCASLKLLSSVPHLFAISPPIFSQVAKWRAAVGPDFPLMIDCYMALTLPYAIELAKKCEPYNIKWIEECLLPDDYEGQPCSHSINFVLSFLSILLLN